MKTNCTYYRNKQFGFIYKINGKFCYFRIDNTWKQTHEPQSDAIYIMQNKTIFESVTEQEAFIDIL